jgi:hypothetical protein
VYTSFAVWYIGTNDETTTQGVIMDRTEKTIIGVLAALVLIFIAFLPAMNRAVEAERAYCQERGAVRVTRTISVKPLIQKAECETPDGRTFEL